MYTIQGMMTLLALWCEAMDKFISIISTPYVELYYMFRPNLPIVTNILDQLVDILLPPNLTILTVMFGQLIVTYVVYQVAIWILNIVT